VRTGNTGTVSIHSPWHNIKSFVDWPWYRGRIPDGGQSLGIYGRQQGAFHRPNTLNLQEKRRYDPLFAPR